jgi:hypothetical protein
VVSINSGETIFIWIVEPLLSLGVEEDANRITPESRCRLVCQSRFIAVDVPNDRVRSMVIIAPVKGGVDLPLGQCASS